MKVEIEEISSVKRKLRVQVPADVVTQEFERAYGELRRTARLKGFRPGKAPRAVLERYYGDQVRYDVTARLLQDSYRKTLEDHELVPVAQPDLEETDVRTGQDFNYTAVVEVKPKVKIAEELGLKLERETVQVTDEQVETRLEEIREMFSRLEDVEGERPVQEGDVVLVQQRMLVDGEPVSGQEPQEQMLEVVPGRTEEGLLKALPGLRPGEEAQVPRDLPTDHPDATLAGRQGVLHVVVKAIRKKLLPDLNDEFAQRLGEYKSLEELKARVRRDLEEGEQQRIRASMNQAIIDQLVDKHPIEVPDAMVNLQVQEMIRSTRRRLAVQGLTLEQTGSSPEQLQARYRDSAIKAVRASLILESIALREGFQASEEALEEAYQKIAQQTGREVQQVKDLYRDPGALESLKGNILEERTLDFLRDTAKMVDKKPKGKA